MWLLLPIAFVAVGLAGLWFRDWVTDAVTRISALNPLITRHANWRYHVRIVTLVVLVGWCVIGLLMFVSVA